MEQADIARRLPGGRNVIAAFGEWPSFHDAEILRVLINRGGRSSVTIRLMIPAYQQKCVTFTFERIADMRLEGEDADVQNVIGALTIEADDRFTTVHFSPCYGLAGYIKAALVSVLLEQATQGVV
jgi:immunity protein 50 of polymorphic toxin system